MTAPDKRPDGRFQRFVTRLNRSAYSRPVLRLLLSVLGLCLALTVLSGILAGLAGLASLVYGRRQLDQLIELRWPSQPVQAYQVGTVEQERRQPSQLLRDSGLLTPESVVLVEGRCHWLDLLYIMPLPLLVLLFVLLGGAGDNLVWLLVIGGALWLSLSGSGGLLQSAWQALRRNRTVLWPLLWLSALAIAIQLSLRTLPIVEWWLIGLAVYWPLRRYVIWRNTRYVLTTSLAHIVVRPPRLFLAERTETIPTRRLSYVRGERTSLERLLNLNCGWVQLDTAAQGDEAFKRELVRLQDWDRFRALALLLLENRL